MKVAVFATMKKTAASVKLAAAAGAAERRLRVAKHLEGQVNKMVGFCLAMRVGGRRRQSTKRQHNFFDPGGPTVDAGAD